MKVFTCSKYEIFLPVSSFYTISNHFNQISVSNMSNCLHFCHKLLSFATIDFEFSKEKQNISCEQDMSISNSFHVPNKFLSLYSQISQATAITRIKLLNFTDIFSRFLVAKGTLQHFVYTIFIYFHDGIPCFLVFASKDDFHKVSSSCQSTPHVKESNLRKQSRPSKTTQANTYGTNSNSYFVGYFNFSQDIHELQFKNNICTYVNIYIYTYTHTC